MQMFIDGDFPVLVNFVEGAGCIFVNTQYGNFFLYEATRGVLIFKTKLLDDPCIFAAKKQQNACILLHYKRRKIATSKYRR